MTRNEEKKLEMAEMALKAEKTQQVLIRNFMRHHSKESFHQPESSSLTKFTFQEQEKLRKQRLEDAKSNLEVTKAHMHAHTCPAFVLNPMSTLT